MSLILATGSNLSNRKENLIAAKERLCQHFKLIKTSHIYKSAAVEYLDQPYFYNQVIEFELPQISPHEVLQICQSIEDQMGRLKTIPKGPRNIDIDILFYGLQNIQSDHLTIPHPAWCHRSFVLFPLSELPYFNIIKKNFSIPSFPLNNHAILVR